MWVKHLLYKNSKKVPFTALCGWPWPTSASSVLAPPAFLPSTCDPNTPREWQGQAPSTHSWDHNFPGCNQRTNSRNLLVLPSSMSDEGGGGIPTPFSTWGGGGINRNLEVVISFSTSPHTEGKETKRRISPISKQQTPKLTVLFKILKNRERKESL